jgi:hypothetical protein
MTARLLRNHPVVPVVLALLAVPALAVRASGGLQKSIFVSALDEARKPVMGLTADDFAIREDGVDRAIVAVKPASQPLSVAVLVDTAQGSRVTDAYGTPEDYVRDLRVAVTSFAKELMAKSPDAEASLMEFGQAAMTMVPFTRNPLDFEKGANKIVARPGVGSVLLEALAQANSDLAERKTARRAIVSLNLEPSDEQSREDPKKIILSFKNSGAQLWAVSVQRGGLKNSKRDLVINDFSKNTGGQRDYVVAISAVEGIMKGYAEALASQYEVVYERPESKKPPVMVQTGSRPGVKVHASGFPPQ